MVFKLLFLACPDSFAVLQSDSYDLDAIRKKQMDAVNPAIILRNWMAQEAIAKAEQGDFSLVQGMHSALKNPYFSPLLW